MRAKIGLIAVVLLAIALWMTFRSGTAGTETWAGAFVRVGLVMAAIWLALPQLRHAPPWLLLVIGAVLVVLARWPRYLLLAILLGVVAAFLRPRPKK